MPDSVDLSYAIGLKPAQAIEYFQSKGYTIGFNWHEVEARAHATAFTVAGILRQDILQDVRAGLQDSLDNGLTLEQFRRQMTQKLTQKGWLADKAKLVADEDGVLEGKQLTPRRLRTIFETNMQSSYGAGRYAQQMENATDRPYWTRVAVMDLRTRPAHAALNGLTAHYDDPIWQFAYPPDGWGCRCRVRARSQSDIDSKNISVWSSEGHLETVQQAWGPQDTREVQAFRYNGQLYTPDAGFGHNPGQGWLAGLGQRLMDRSTTAPPQMAALAIQHTLSEPQLLDAITSDMRRFVNQSLLREPAGAFRHAGALSTRTLDALASRGRMPDAAVMTVTDSAVVQSPGPLWELLPAQLRQPAAVLADGDDLLYVIRNGESLHQVRAVPVQNAAGYELQLPDGGAELTPASLQSLAELPLLEGTLNGL
ncbi:phage head morphogenesis protein [Klebsiella pneumoniae]|uniref:phage head morphogenesis protein n=1 Tax=Klebsiella pneumoniae TaxID=573 RepID=UPI000E2B053A|nr:phage minor head protein [Klebsiella pneumoniae]SYT84793.1 phage head morphogenesis protein, SPP1 gp7 family [Klebsiella pneumoniae]